MSDALGELHDRILRIVANGRKRHYTSSEIARFIVDAVNEYETHMQRMSRLMLTGSIDRKCRADDLTVGARCLNCGHTPPDHKATLTAPNLTRMHT